MAQQFAAILGVGLAIFGLFFLASGEFGTGSQQAESMTLYDQSFGEIGAANEDYRNINFEKITVGETRGNIPAYNREEITLSDKLFGSQKETIYYNATQPRSGNITFEVLGKNGDGRISVKVNGETVFNNYLVATAEEEVEIPEGALNPGTNTITIEAKRSGFFGSLEYVLEDFELVVNDRKYHDYETSFRMYEYEIKDFDTAQLNFRIPPGQSTKNSPLEVYVNDNRVFSQTTVRGEHNVELTPQNSDLQPGYNEIRFETDSDSAYTLESTALSVRYRGAVQLEEVEEGFSLNESQLNYVQRDDTNETLSFRYQNLLTTEPMNITLNEEVYELNPQNGLNTVNIDEDVLELQNQVSIRSRNVYEMNDFRIQSVKE
ncbi:MAG: hypothetical protein ACI977_000899 [Candidatus Nanohaloarchaea archaeon]|jgi:hypothetical protein